MIYRIDTVKDLEKVKSALPLEVIPEIQQIVFMLEKEYGADRDKNSDGGYVLFLDSADDLEIMKQEHFSLCETVPEHVTHLPVKSYINALFLHHNEFGVNLILPSNIAPTCLLKEVDDG